MIDRRMHQNATALGIAGFARFDAQPSTRTKVAFISSWRAVALCPFVSHEPGLNAHAEAQDSAGNQNHCDDCGEEQHRFWHGALPIYGSFLFLINAQRPSWVRASRAEVRALCPPNRKWHEADVIRQPTPDAGRLRPCDRRQCNERNGGVACRWIPQRPTGSPGRVLRAPRSTTGSPLVFSCTNFLGPS